MLSFSKARVANRYIYPLCLVFISFVLTLILAECLVRVLYPHTRDHILPANFFKIQDDLGWKLRPLKQVVHNSRYFHTIYSTNTHGYRDIPRKLRKRDDVYRVLLYGDSQVFGWGIPEDQRFSNIIEDAYTSLEIWNLAVPGYGLDQQILSYEKYGNSYNADEVILYVSKSTIVRMHYNYIYKKYKPQFVMDQKGYLRVIPIPKGMSSFMSVLYEALSPFYLPYFLERRIMVLKTILSNINNRQGKTSNVEKNIIGKFEKTVILRAKEIALERKHRISVLADADLNRKTRDQLKHFCDSAGIGFLEYIFDIRDFNNGLVHGKEDHHWNRRANKLIAEQLMLSFKQRAKE